MVIKRACIIWLTCLMLFMASSSAFAATSGGQSGNTDVEIGVVVNYMGKVCFQVLEAKTNIPIPYASIEIYIPSLSRYVLFGLTDANGEFYLDIAYDVSGISETQFTSVDGDMRFTGGVLFLPNNELDYKVYKADWRPHPKFEKAVITTKELPMVLTTYLYTKDKWPPSKGGGGGGTGGKLLGAGSIKGEETSEEETTTVDPGDTEGTGIDTLPKTGIEGYMNLWALGFCLFIVAIFLILWLMKKEDQKSQEQDSK